MQLDILLFMHMKLCVGIDNCKTMLQHLIVDFSVQAYLSNKIFDGSVIGRLHRIMVL